MIRLFTFLLLAVLSFPGWAATVWEQDWEMAVAPTQGAESTAAGISYAGNCYKLANGGPFDSVSTSTKYKRKGNRSVRLETDSRFSNGLPSANCASNWKTEGTTNGGLGKHRNEIRYGYGVSQLDGWNHGEERWFRASYFIPSDEGDYTTWRNSSSNIMIHQSMARLISSGAADATHELAFILRPNATLEPSIVWRKTTPDSGEVEERGDYFFPVKIDAWNDVLIRERRHWQTAAENPTSYGVVTIWFNCPTWTPACVPVVNIQGAPIAGKNAGRVAIQHMDERFFKGGLYDVVKATGGFRRVMYMDAIKLGKRTTETVDEMFTEMADAFVSPCTVDCGGDPPAITSVNEGAALTQNLFPVPITATNVTDVFDCIINNNGADHRVVNWNRELGTGVFSAGDINQYPSSTATLKCYDLTFDKVPNFTSGWNNSYTTNTVVTGLAHHGYTSGLKIVKSAVNTNADAYRGISDFICVSGNRCRFDFTYYVDDLYKNDLYFHIGDAVVDNRIRLVGTAGNLTLGTAINAGFGTNVQIANRTAGNGVYRASIWWTVNQATQTYKIRAGWSNSVPVNSEMILLDVVGRKNWTTTVLDYPVALSLGNVDTTPPTVGPCTIINALDPQPGVSPTPYRATVTCGTTELGGDYFIMLKDTNVAPANNDAVIAGTGALRFATGEVSELAFSAEFSGLAYQDLWAYAVHRDAATNKSTVATATFDDGVTYVKRIKFLNSATRLRTRNGAVFGGSLDYFTLHPTDPRLPGPKTDLVLIDNPTITAGIPNFTEADTQCGTCSGSINALPLGQYWYSARSTDGTIKAVNTINIVDAAE